MREGSFGKYFLLRKLASGGMGEVFLAKQRGLEGFEKTLVIKRILAHHTDNEEYVGMFFSEGRLAAQMSHSNIVQVYEMGETDGAYFIAMEYVAGKAIKDLIDGAQARGTTVPLAHIADIVAKLCSGLSYAHSLYSEDGVLLNIIHRDINPHNVLVSYGGEVKIIDFGIAKSQMNEHKTETGTIKGKFVYMSPEQSAAEKIDKRSDIFSIGIVLYEMLTGENPFQKSNIVLSLDAIQRADPPLPSTLRAELLPFDAIIQKALAKKPDERYADAADMQQDLQRLVLLGEVPRPTQTLSQYMHELFREQIEKEQRFLQETGRGMIPADAASMRSSRSVAGSSLRSNSTASATNAPTPAPTALPVIAPKPVASPRAQAAAPSTPRTGGSAARRRKRRMTLYAILSCILVTASGVAAILLLSQSHHESVGGTPSITNPISPPPTPRLPERSASADPVPAPVPPPAPVAVEATPAPVVAQAAPANDGGNSHKTNKRTHKPESALPDKVVKTEPAEAVAAPVEVVKRPTPSDAKVSGHFMINSQPPAPVFRDGHNIGSTMPLRIDISNPSGTIKIGEDASPFQLVFQYRFNAAHSLEFAFESKPWANVKKGGAAVGKTPQTWTAIGDGAQHLEFSNPQVSAPMTVVLRYFPG